jgi:2-aminobenzoate-CoA ligase
VVIQGQENVGRDASPLRGMAVDRFVFDHLPPMEQWPVFQALPDHLAPGFNATSGMLDAHIGHGDDMRSALLQAEVNGVRTCSYGELFARVNRIAHVLVQQLGVQPGNRVLLRAPNNLMLAACWLAVVRVGAVAVTTMPLLRAKELSEIVRKARVQYALCDVRFCEELQRCAQNLHASESELDSQLLQDIVYFNSTDHDGLERRMHQQPENFQPFPAGSEHPALIAFTSGTTGIPKGTVHLHRDLHAICDIVPRAILDMTPDDRCCGTSPLGFTFGLGGLLCFPLTYGASTVLAETLTPAALLSLIEKCQATINFTVPTFYRQMLPAVPAHRLSSLRACVSAGEALPIATREQWRAATGLQMIDGLGSTEMLHMFVSSHPRDHRDGTIGRALPGYEVTILDDGMQPVSPGVHGRLAVRGPTGCRYLADQRQVHYVQDGWNLTGDIGSMDADGYIAYCARSDDMIVSAGYNIAGPEVEAVLLNHPSVAECAVVGVPDEERGVIVKAYVVLRDPSESGDALEQALQQFAKSEIAPYKYPRMIEFCDSLPRTETGKLQRFRLRDAATTLSIQSVVSHPQVADAV